MSMRPYRAREAVIGTVLAILPACPAVAADIPAGLPPVEQPAFVPEPVGAFTWSGFYLGVHGGYGWGDFGSADEDDFFDEADDRILDEANGFLAGGQIGFNYQAGALVWGAEADLAWAGLEDETDVLNGVVPGTLAAETDWLATARGRLGVALDRFMIYGTGGAAFAGADIAYRELGTESGESQSLFGWTAGAGVEGMITPNLTARLEYLFVDLQEEKLSFTDSGGSTFPADVELDAHLLRGGLNYKFNF